MLWNVNILKLCSKENNKHDSNNRTVERYCLVFKQLCHQSKHAERQLNVEILIFVINLLCKTVLNIHWKCICIIFFEILGLYSTYSFPSFLLSPFISFLQVKSDLVK